jgi:hypothetical protein
LRALSTPKRSVAEYGATPQYRNDIAGCDTVVAQICDCFRA